MRQSGILMPIFSLPSKYGIGTLGKEAYNFVDFLKDAGQQYWQVLPIGPTGFGDSPYQSFSSYAGNPYFIDLDLLCQSGYLDFSDIANVDFGSNSNAVDYGKLYENRKNVLYIAASNFLKNPNKEYNDFLLKNDFWLNDYCLFTAIKQDLCVALKDFPKELLSRSQTAITNAKSKYKDVIEKEKAIQFFFFNQWQKLKEYANINGIEIIGDIPIYVSCDSADLWQNPDCFLLDENFSPAAVAGTPPDAFSATGQLWGNPLYNWNNIKKDNYRLWLNRLNFCEKLFNVVRIDHFRAFDEYFAIPYGDKTAQNGKWQKGPGKEFIDVIKQNCKNIKIIAEDLGDITKSVEDLLSYSGFYGMAVMQFAFNPKEQSKYLPHNLVNKKVLYTGTHDNNTINGWLKDITAEEFDFCVKYLRLKPEEGYNWGFIKSAYSTVADIVIVPMQDFLGLGKEGRINTPSVATDNWVWRIGEGCINSWLAGIIKENSALYGRNL